LVLTGPRGKGFVGRGSTERFCPANRVSAEELALVVETGLAAGAGAGAGAGAVVTSASLTGFERVTPCHGAPPFSTFSASAACWAASFLRSFCESLVEVKGGVEAMWSGRGDEEMPGEKIALSGLGTERGVQELDGGDGKPLPGRGDADGPCEGEGHWS
jgi:hypothetical protein